MERTVKHGKAKTFFRILFLLLSIAEMIFLCVESLLPGKVSSAQSGAVGNVVDGIMTGLSGDEVRDVPPERIEILFGGEACEHIGIKVGDAVRATLGYFPQNTSSNHRAATWSSSDEEVLTVHGGKIEARAVGEAVVTASLEEGIMAQLRVTVEEVAAERLTLTFEDGETSESLPAGTSTRLIAALEPDNATAPVRFSSEDESVAAVDESGTVRALSPGKTALIARYVPLCGEEGALLARVEIEVTDAPPPRSPESISLSLPEYIQNNVLYVGAEGIASAIAMPAIDPSDRLLFASSDCEVLSVDIHTGEFIAHRKGHAVLTVCSSRFPEIALSLPLEVRNASLGASVASGRTDRTLKATESAGAFALSLCAGECVPLLVSASPDEYFVRFASSDPETAAISEDGTLLAFRANSKEVALTLEVADNREFSLDEGGLCERFTLLVTVAKQSFSSGVSGWGLFVRKLFGHFGAFLLLGILLGTTAALFDSGSGKKRLIVLAVLILVGFAFAGLTEILQLPLFTAGRGSSFRDVLIDFSGYLPAMLAVYGGYLAVRCIWGSVRRRRGKK